MSVNVLISTFAPFPTISLAVAGSETLASVKDIIHERCPAIPVSELFLSTHSGCSSSETLISSLGNEGFVTLRLSPLLLGGKGGFGSQLRAAGGRMSSRKTGNHDSCRDLSGRRLSTIKQAKKLAEYLEAEPDRHAAKAEAQKNKLEALEKKLAASDPSTGLKRRFNDTEYIEQSRELVDGVKSAVSVALLKKKKPKLTHDEPAVVKPAVVKPAVVEPAVVDPAPTVEAIGA